MEFQLTAFGTEGQMTVWKQQRCPEKRIVRSRSALRAQ